ncbi:hypothetical protein H2198_005745 [Neophaeococcomyces mojaviensis]|uniref:Uncharacterized protein n=1 Tax=Neophaeococcomyces mojaviensis TaxID=3383035 RepID=A0ACC3A4R1_9EURO|nr:hypothetical protein H2198_005745 [Knufia sp. JES_112]
MPHQGSFVYNYALPIPEEDYHDHHGHSEAHGHSYMIPDQPVIRGIPRTAITVAPQDVFRGADRHGHSSMPNASTRYRDHNNDDIEWSNTNYTTSSRQALPRRISNHETMSDDYSYVANPAEISNEHSPGSSPNEGSYSIPFTKSKSKRYYCDFPECVDKNTGKRSSVGRKADLKRHVSTVHGGPTIDCPRPNCWRKGEDGFCRKDHRDEHLRGYHNREVPNKSNRTKRDT